MPKIDKTTLKKIPRLKISIYKYENKNTYFCKFYVGKIHYKSGYKEIGLRTKNINEAISKANIEFKIWFSEHKDTTTKKDSNIDLDIAQPYLRFKIRKYKHKTHLKNNEQGERDSSKWNYLKPFFEDIDYKDMETVEQIINDEILLSLQEDGRSGSTINKYFSVLTQMFKKAKDRGMVNYIPDTPTQQVINTPREPYENLELNLINNRCKKEYEKTKDIYFLECKDYFNLLRSAGFRPGLEPLNMKRSDYEFIKDRDNPETNILKFTVRNTKTKPIHYPIANDFFTKHIFPEILNRHSDLKDDDYLLFPFIKDRKTLKNKTGKTFSRFSKDLNLYYYKGGTRPLYSIRHTYATEQWKKGTVIEDISKLMNTSPRMVMSVYLGNSDEALIKLHKRIPNKFKLVK
ncbi:hypothetical protein N9S91_00795 [Candidatus Pelagibacter sp.]|nr:hypothetical protein [Candidatus Pelagibacter sp.]